LGSGHPSSELQVSPRQVKVSAGDVGSPPKPAAVSPASGVGGAGPPQRFANGGPCVPVLLHTALVPRLKKKKKTKQLLWTLLHRDKTTVTL